jgi:hypothetical protein
MTPDQVQARWLRFDPQSLEPLLLPNSLEHVG